MRKKKKTNKNSNKRAGNQEKNDKENETRKTKKLNNSWRELNHQKANF